MTPRETLSEFIESSMQRIREADERGCRELREFIEASEERILAAKRRRERNADTVSHFAHRRSPGTCGSGSLRLHTAQISPARRCLTVEARSPPILGL